LKILIIEDERELLDNLESYLGSFGDEFEVITAPTGEEGIAALEDRSDFDLLLTDVRLPGMDGIDVVRRTVEGWPDVKIVVMTAYGSRELRSTAETEGALRFVEKPIDLDSLPTVLREVYESRQRQSRAVGGLSILDVAQFVVAARETKVIRFQNRNGQGMLVFENGALVHCAAGQYEGSEAFFEMALWGEGSFCELFDLDTRRFRKNVDVSTGDLLDQASEFSEMVNMERANENALPNAAAGVRGGGSSLGDTDSRSSAGAVRASTPRTMPDAKGKTKKPKGKESKTMAIKDYLEEFQSIAGFKGVAVFTAQGEMMESLSVGKLDIKSIGMYANNALLNSQKATDEMGVGRGNLMQIRAPQATVIMRCLNEATDFAASKEGKAHIHAVVIMEPEGNTGMATMILDKAVGKIAEEVR